MLYRTLPHGGEKISVVALGNSSMGANGADETAATVELALEHGVNYFDMAAADSVPFAAFGRAVGSMRRDVYYQVHFGATYTSPGGEYGWTLDTEEIKRSVDWQLRELNTDYIDFGFLHCIDEQEDLASAEETIKYLLSLKEQGVVRHLGMSTHTPETAQSALDLGILDMLMFSINPAYDYVRGEYGIGTVASRMELYRRCEREGVGISVMKPFAAGQLLDARVSPFGAALTPYQCIQYALDKPAVLTVLCGVRDRADLESLLGFFDAPESERDYSVIGTFAPAEAEGVCVYCNHCRPCPAGIDVGLVNKYYDLARAGDAMARDHYMHLARSASDCVGCGHCDSRCPFHVRQSARMREMTEYFGK